MIIIKNAVVNLTVETKMIESLISIGYFAVGVAMVIVAIFVIYVVLGLAFLFIKENITDVLKVMATIAGVWYVVAIIYNSAS